MYDNLRELANDQLLEIEELRARLKAIEEENGTLNRIIEVQQNTIKIYGQIFQLQESELERLRHDSELQDYQQKV